MLCRVANEEADHKLVSDGLHDLECTGIVWKKREGSSSNKVLFVSLGRESRMSAKPERAHREHVLPLCYRNQLQAILIPLWPMLMEKRYISSDSKMRMNLNLDTHGGA